MITSLDEMKKAIFTKLNEMPVIKYYKIGLGGICIKFDISDNVAKYHVIIKRYVMIRDREYHYYRRLRKEDTNIVSLFHNTPHYKDYTIEVQKEGDPFNKTFYINFDNKFKAILGEGMNADYYFFYNAISGKKKEEIKFERTR